MPYKILFVLLLFLTGCAQAQMPIALTPEITHASQPWLDACMKDRRVDLGDINVQVNQAPTFDLGSLEMVNSKLSIEIVPRSTAAADANQRELLKDWNRKAVLVGRIIGHLSLEHANGETTWLARTRKAEEMIKKRVTPFTGWNEDDEGNLISNDFGVVVSIQSIANKQKVVMKYVDVLHARPYPSPLFLMHPSSTQPVLYTLARLSTQPLPLPSGPDGWMKAVLKDNWQGQLRFIPTAIELFATDGKQTLGCYPVI